MEKNLEISLKQKQAKPRNIDETKTSKISASVYFSPKIYNEFC